MLELPPWESWELGRATLALSALMYLGIWIQVSLYHRGGAFRKGAMYVPVISTPIVIGGILAAVVRRDGLWGWIATGLLAFAILDGMIGLFYHLRGSLKQVGGLTMRNLIAGPPPVLPLAYSLIGVLGFLSLQWGPFIVPL